MYQRAGRFTKIHRLSRPVEYQQVFRSPCRSTDDYLLVIARKNSMQHARLGLAISNKHIKPAIARNRFKRIVRESFRLNKQQLKGLDVVVTTHKTLTVIDNKALAKSLACHWQRLAECER